MGGNKCMVDVVSLVPRLMVTSCNGMLLQRDVANNYGHESLSVRASDIYACHALHKGWMTSLIRMYMACILGRKQVNKALHTCTSWYAYAAMFGSSIDTMVPRALQRMYRLHLCLPSYPLLAVFCRPKPLACMSQYGGLRSTGGWTGLQYAGTQSANLSFRPTALTERRSVVCVCV